ncbi:MAG: leucine-rich repeat domain-containing protein [archaeon]|nr:leucine-rich repeat domain-containing protein [archaeon]
MTHLVMNEERGSKRSSSRSFAAVALSLLAVLACLVMVSEPSDAASGTTGDCSWNVTGSTLTISGSGSMGDYTADTAHWGVPNDSITQIIVGDGVTYIGAYAFQSCTQVTSVSLGSSVETIGPCAFYKLGEADFILPESVKYIEEEAFFTEVRSIYFGDGIVRVHERAFFGIFDSDGSEIAITPDNVRGHLFTKVGDKLCRDHVSVDTDVPDMSIDASRGSVLDAASVADVITRATTDASATLTVTCGAATMVFDNTATRNIANADSEIILKEVGVGPFNVPAGSKVFQISFGDTHQLNGGKIAVTVPYDGATSGMKLYYIDGEGNVTEAGDVSFSAGKATFTLDHLSTYAIADLSPAPSGGSDNTMLYLGVFVVIGIVLLVALLFVAKPSFLRRN